MLGSIGNYLFVRDTTDVVVAQAIPALVKRLQEEIHPPQTLRLHAVRGLEGNVNETGFSLRKTGRGTKPAVVMKGTIAAQDGGTIVHVMLRHGRQYVFFVWLLCLLGIVGLPIMLINPTTRPEDKFGWIGCLVMLVMGGLWYLCLWWDIRTVKREIRALLEK